MSASIAVARPMAIILVTSRVGGSRGGWIGAVEDAAFTRCATRRILVDWSTVRGKLDHAPVVRIRHVHVAVAIDGYPAGEVDLASAVAISPKLRKHPAIRR